LLDAQGKPTDGMRSAPLPVDPTSAVATPSNVPNAGSAPATEQAGDSAAREAERLKREALETKLAALEARVKEEADARRKAEAARLRDAERARLDDELRKQAEAERERQEQARLAEEARKAEDARRAEEARRQDAARKDTKPADAQTKTPPAVPGAELLALAEQARSRGDDIERLELLRKAGHAGNPQALFELGDAYASGRGVTLNNFQAYVWLRRAEIAGHKEAVARVQQVKTRLQPAEVAHAERLLR